MNNPFDLIDARLSNIETLLLDLKYRPEATSAPTTPQEELLTVQQAAQFLSLSVPTIYGMVSRKELPYMKRSKRLYFSRVELTNYLKAGRKKTAQDFANDADKFLANL